MHSHAKLPWAKFVNADNRANAGHEVLDLLDRLLRYDHCERLTAAEALSHTYFSACLAAVRVGAPLTCVLFADMVRLDTSSKSAERFSDSGFCST